MLSPKAIVMSAPELLLRVMSGSLVLLRLGSVTLSKAYVTTCMLKSKDHAEPAPPSTGPRIAVPVPHWRHTVAGELVPPSPPHPTRERWPHPHHGHGRAVPDGMGPGELALPLPEAGLGVGRRGWSQ